MKLLFLMVVLAYQNVSAELFKSNFYHSESFDAGTVVHGDVDGDGFNDLVFAGNPKGQILFYINNQNNGFEAKALYMSRFVAQVELADINGDGALDLIVLSIESTSVSNPIIIRPGIGSQALSTTYLEVFINEGNGQFNLEQPLVSIEPEGKGMTFKVADFNKDGYLDIINTTYTQRAFPLLSYEYFTHLYSGAENMAFESSPLDVHLERGTQLADFNGDGNLDLWNFSNGLNVYLYNIEEEIFEPNGISIYLDPLDPSLPPNTISNSSISYDNVTLGDIDNDGDLDIQAFEHNGQFHRYMREGNGFVRRHRELELPFPFVKYDEYQVSPQYGGLIDLENDGLPETWVTSTESKNIVIVDDNHEQPAFQVVSDDAVNQLSRKIVVGDFTADGFSDVVTLGAHGINLWANQGNKQLSSTQSQDGRWGQKSLIKSADIDGDGFVDVILAGADGIMIKIGNGRGVFTHREYVTNQAISELLLVGESGSVVFFGVYDNSIYKWEKNLSGGCAESIVYEDSTGPITNLQSIDMNQDNMPDLLFMVNGTDLMYQEQTNSGFAEKQLIQSNVKDYVVVEVNQEPPEIFVIHENPVGYTSPGIGFFGYYLPEILIAGLENGDFITKQTMTDNSFLDGLQVDHLAYPLQTFDINLDGKLDVIISFPDQYLSGLIWFEKEGGIWKERQLAVGVPDFFHLKKKFADFNNDGFMDVFGFNTLLTFNSPTHLFSNPNNSSEEYTNIYFLGSEEGFQQAQSLDINMRITANDIADIDNDGDMDLLHINNYSEYATQINLTIDQDFSGQWFNPAQNGHGLQVEEVISNGIPQVNLSWYAFNNGLPIWLTGVGPIVGNTATVSAAITDGPQFGTSYNSNDLQLNYWGDLKLTIHNTEDMTLDWDGSPQGYGQGSLELSRLSVIKPTTPTLNSINSCHTGSWFNPEENGHGFMTQVVEVESETQVVLTWFTYLDGEQYWIYAQGPVEGNKAILQAQSGLGGMFPPNYNPEDVSFDLWGEISFELKGNDKALITWDPIMAGFEAGSTAVNRLTHIDRYRCD